MGTRSKGTTVPMKVEYQPAWLTWVASTTTCLRALGSDCDLADVAGASGYAFHLCVHEEVCPSGPTVFNWSDLEGGVQYLGRSTLAFHGYECHGEGHADDRTRAHCREAFEIARREIEAGRPCVMWGAYVPEFAVAVGVENDSYLVSSFKQCVGEDQPPIACEEVDAPGGPYVLAFPTPTAKSPPSGDHHAVVNALKFLRRPVWGPYRYGVAAYDAWIAALDSGKAHPFGNAYNAQCYAEGRALARDFLRRVAGRNAAVAGALDRAVAAYAGAADALKRFAGLFPFPPGEQMNDAGTRAEGVEALKQAKAEEARAVEALAEAAEGEWAD